MRRAHLQTGYASKRKVIVGQREIAQGAPPQPLLHPNLAELYRQKLAELHKALEHPTHAAEAVEKIRALIDAIVLTPEEGKLRVDLIGALSGILSVAQKGQRPVRRTRPMHRK